MEYLQEWVTTLHDFTDPTPDGFVDAYASDAAFNGLEFDRAGEREQVESYADSIAPPGEDTRLPPWDEAPVSTDEVREAARADLDAVEEDYA